MPPLPISSRISSWGKSCRTVSIGGGTKPASGALPPTELPIPALSRHSGQIPCGASAASGFWQPGHNRCVSMTLYLFLKQWQPKVTGRILPEKSSGRSARQDLQQVSQFAFDFFRRGDGARDFLAQDLAITLTQAVDGGFEGAFGQAELSGQKSIRLGVMFADQAGFEGFEEIGLAFGAAFGGEPLEHGFQQREGPAALKDLIGRGGVGRFLPVARLGGVELQGHEPGGPAALLGMGSIPLVGEEIPEGSEQKR